MEQKDFKWEISARHVHLSAHDCAVLFGPDATLTKVKDLSVANEYKADKVVTIIGQKRNLERVAVLGPFRPQTQVEVAVTDTYTLGVSNVPVRLSGDLAGSAPVTLQGPCGTVHLPEGMIIAQRHLHINAADLAKFQLHDGQEIALTIGEARAVTFHHVVVRQSDVAVPTVHLDTDEGNAVK